MNKVYKKDKNPVGHTKLSKRESKVAVNTFGAKRDVWWYTTQSLRLPITHEALDFARNRTEKYLMIASVMTALMLHILHYYSISYIQQLFWSVCYCFLPAHAFFIQVIDEQGHVITGERTSLKNLSESVSSVRKEGSKGADANKTALLICRCSWGSFE